MSEALPKMFAERIRLVLRQWDAKAGGLLSDEMRFGYGMSYHEQRVAVRDAGCDPEDWEALMMETE